MNDKTPKLIPSSTLPNGTWATAELDCGHLEMSENFGYIWNQFQYWCEGVLFTVVGGFGAIGNIIAILILTTR